MMLNDPHPCIVISSEARNLCYSRLRDTRFPHVCRAPLHFLQLSFIPPVPYPPLRGTFPSRGRLFLYFAALRSFDSVLIFSDKQFFNIRRFSPLRMTKCAAPPPLNLLSPLNPLNPLLLCYSHSRDSTPRGLTCHQETFGHRPIYICGEAATTTLNPEP